MADDPEGRGGLRAWNATRPPFVEADAVQRAGAVRARSTGAPLYIVHTSSARRRWTAALRQRDAGTRHLHRDLPALPHARRRAGRAASRQDQSAAARAGRPGGALARPRSPATSTPSRPTTCIATSSAKAGGIWKASPGCPGLETLLPVMLSEGHHERGLPLARIADAARERTRPAAMGLARKGASRSGSTRISRSSTCGRDGRVGRDDVRLQRRLFDLRGPEFKGQVVHTLVRGRFACATACWSRIWLEAAATSGGNCRVRQAKSTCRRPPSGSCRW